MSGGQSTEGGKADGGGRRLAFTVVEASAAEGSSSPQVTRRLRSCCVVRARGHGGRSVSCAARLPAHTRDARRALLQCTTCTTRVSWAFQPAQGRRRSASTTATTPSSPPRNRTPTPEGPASPATAHGHVCFTRSRGASSAWRSQKEKRRHIVGGPHGAHAGARELHQTSRACVSLTS